MRAGSQWMNRLLFFNNVEPDVQKTDVLITYEIN